MDYKARKCEKNELRSFPIKKEILSDKKICDIIYGYLQINSELIPDDPKHKLDPDLDRQRFIYKSNTTFKAVKAYFEKVAPDFSISDNTLRSRMKILLQSGLVQEGTYNNCKIYYLPDLKKGEFAIVKTNTLRYLTNTATTGVIKTYVYLLTKKRQHDYLAKQNIATYKFSFTYQSLLLVLGYSATNEVRNNKVIKDILVCLTNNGLIKYSEKWIPAAKGEKATHCFILEDVSEDYYNAGTGKITNESSNGVMSIPVIENKISRFKF